MIKYVKSIDRTTTEKNYTPNTGLKRIQFSNNVSSYGMVSSENGLMIPNGLRTQLKSVKINGNCTNLIDGCFMDCKSLSSVNIPYTCTEFGASAFMNCENLEEINVLSDPNFIIQHTGDRCFANCSKLTDISVNLATGVSKSYGSNTFENCKNLKDVTFVKGGSSYLCPYMFNGCDSLTGIHIDSTNTTYTSEGAFSNLKSLKEIYLPKNIQSVQEGFFKDDINLEKVEFEDTDPNVGLQSILEDAFNGCTKLNSLTLPQTIKDFSQIDRNAFNNAELTSVYFNGMDSTMFTDEIHGLELDYDLGKWYGSTDYAGTRNYTGTDGQIHTITSSGHPKLYTISKGKETQTKNDLIKLNTLSGVPLLLFEGMIGCGNCDKFENMIINNWSKLHELGNIIILGVYVNDGSRNKLKKDLTTGKNTLPYLTFKYTDKNGIDHIYHRRGLYLQDCSSSSLNGVSEIRTFADLKKWIPNEAKTIVDTTKIRYEQKQNLSLFGLDKPYCYYFDKDGNQYKVLSSESDRAYTDQVIEYNINSDVSSNFKYGTWFSNSKQIKEFADLNNIPVLIEYGEPVRCPPCKEFKRKIFNNDKFQEWVKNRPYLFCCVEADEEATFHVRGTNEYYVMHEWCRTVPLDQREPDYSPNQIIPVMTWYWNSPNGLVKDVHSLHGSGVMNLNMTMDEIMKKTDDLFSSYNRNNVFNRIEQTEITTNDGKFAGYMYVNQSGDENGTWFDVSTRDSLNEIPKTIDINGYKIITSLKVGDDSEFSDGTYMYRDFQDGLYNKQGIIFKVQSSKIVYIYRYTRKSSDVYVDPVKGKYDFKKWYVIKNESDIEQFNNMISDADELDLPVVIFQAKGYTNTLPKQLYDIITSDEFGLRINFKNMYFIAVDTSNTKVSNQLKAFITKGKTTKSGKTGYSSYSQSNNRLFCYQNCVKCGGDVNKPSIATELKLDKNTTIEDFLDFVTKSFDIEKLNKGDPIVDPEP